MAQDYIEGKNVAQLIQELAGVPKISWEPGLRVAFHIAQALDFTWQHHLTHGNVTPKNILVHSTNQAALLNDLRLMKALKGSRLKASVMDKKFHAERTYLH